MGKYLKKLLFLFFFAGSSVFISYGFLNYLNLDWSVNYSVEPVVSVFQKFKHIKYPKVFGKIKNANLLSESAKEIQNKIKNTEKQILKIYKNASSLFYLDYLPIEPIQKEFGPVNPIELAKKLEIKPPVLFQIPERNELLSLDNKIQLPAFNIENETESVVWESFYEELGIEAEILAYADFFKDEVNQEDAVKLVQSATKRSSKKIEDEKGDDLVFFSYKEEKEEESISTSVLKAIERELKQGKAKKVASRKSVGGYNVTTPSKEKEENEVKYKAKSNLMETEVVTIGVEIDKKINDQISGIEFVPHYNKNDRFYDESEGVIKIASRYEASDYIYGTFLSKDYVNMRTAIPLYLGGGIFEIPLIEKASLNELLDKEELNGLGSTLLVDLGDNAIDVDIDKEFEARTFLNDNFKITTQEGSYKYILYVGVEPGNAVLRYLDSAGKTYEKLSFLADAEMTYEHFSVEDSFTFKFETFELNTLSKKAKELTIAPRNITKFGSGISPDQVGLNSFKFENFVSLKDSNTYLEFSHLGNSIFAGMRRSSYVILPSGAFVDSIIKAEGLEDLEHHCMIQLNLKNPVKNIQYDGEDRNGPMEVNLHYLDEDGVLSNEPSLLSKHAFLLGSGQGIINMKVDYLNGTELIMQSFCSYGTYLVEQL